MVQTGTARGDKKILLSNIHPKPKNLGKLQIQPLLIVNLIGRTQTINIKDGFKDNLNLFIG